MTKIINLTGAIPIFKHSCYYIENGFVVPIADWLAADSDSGLVAINVDDNFDLVPVINDNGVVILTLRNHKSGIIEAFDDDRQRLYFSSEKAAATRDFKFSVYLSKYADKKNKDNYYGTDTLAGYHDYKMLRAKKGSYPEFTDENTEYIVGVEVEKVDANLVNKGLCYEIFEGTGWKKERDGSLSNGGFEMVSPKMPLMDTDKIGTIIASVSEYIAGNIDSSCGGHLNFSKKGTSSKDILKGIKGIVPFLYSIYENRLTNDYCYAKAWTKYFTRIEKKTAFYLKDAEILEIRLPSGVRNKAQLEWRLQLMRLAFFDIGRNFNQFALKMSSRESALYKHFNTEFSRDKIKAKILLAEKYARIYKVGKLSESVKKIIRARFNDSTMFLS